MGTEMRGAAIGLLYRKILATRSDGFAAAGQGVLGLGLILTVSRVLLSSTPPRHVCGMLYLLN